MKRVAWQIFRYLFLLSIERSQLAQFFVSHLHNRRVKRVFTLETQRYASGSWHSPQV